MRQQEQDGVQWSVGAVQLGGVGLDLRAPTAANALTELLNARFVDERRVEPRAGHVGYPIQYADAFDPIGSNYSFSDSWLYGHGAVVEPRVVSGGNSRHPLQIRGSATFSFEGSDVAWTGDRLFTVRKDGFPAVGASALWSRTSEAVLARGIPAYLPLQTDMLPPAFIGGAFTETCLTASLRIYVHTESNGLVAHVLDRGTGGILFQGDIAPASGAVEPVVFASGDRPVVVWRTAGEAGVLSLQFWNGTSWSSPSTISTGVAAYDVALVPGGFHLLLCAGTGATKTLSVTRYVGTTPQPAPYAPNTALNMTGITSVDGGVALDVSPAGELGVLCVRNGLVARVFSPAAAPITGVGWTTVESSVSWSGGLSIKSRALPETTGTYSWVVHAGTSLTGGRVVVHQLAVSSSGIAVDTARRRSNSCLASKSFRIGDEVFCWLTSRGTTNTSYLVGGVAGLQVCGYSETQEADLATFSDRTIALQRVQPDPLATDGTKVTWVRKFVTGQPYAHAGNVRSGDIDFLPPLSIAKFGRSVYLSGSAVRNWDGVVLGDVGFHDVPQVTAATPASTGGSLGTGNYFFRIYPVRYNGRGERFQGAAATFGPVVTGAGSTNKIDLTIATVPSTNHADVILEVYRTAAGGTAFFLDGTLQNNFGVQTIAYSSTRKDQSSPAATDDLTSQPGDPHAPQVGQPRELQEFGPEGCAILAVSGDRLWGAGGQVPAGFVQFSKLQEPGEGAGFDILADFQKVDTEGQPITLIHALNDTTVVHQRNKMFVIGGGGPDNFGRGAFDVPRIVLADGATNAIAATTQRGVLYWGEDGPRMLTNNYDVMNISAPIRELASRLVPVGVQVDLARREAVWYTREGDALLWNYLGDASRWARWSGLRIAGCSESALITTTGRLLVESSSALGDDGRPFEFIWRTGDLRSSSVLQGAQLVRSVGVSGKFLSDHKLRMRVYYNGSPLWSDEWIWHPADNTWLASGAEHATRTPAQVDADRPGDKSGAYLNHKRVTRNECSFFRVEVSDMGVAAPSYTPYELVVEVGAREGLARIPVPTFGG